MVIPIEHDRIQYKTNWTDSEIISETKFVKIQPSTKLVSSPKQHKKVTSGQTNSSVWILIYTNYPNLLLSEQSEI